MRHIVLLPFAALGFWGLHEWSQYSINTGGYDYELWPGVITIAPIVTLLLSRLLLIATAVWFVAGIVATVRKRSSRAT